MTQAGNNAVTLHKLARSIVLVADHVDQAWEVQGGDISVLVRRMASIQCHSRAERDLVCLLLEDCWNDALDWAREHT